MSYNISDKEFTDLNTIKYRRTKKLKAYRILYRHKSGEYTEAKKSDNINFCVVEFENRDRVPLNIIRERGKHKDFKNIKEMMIKIWKS